MSKQSQNQQILEYLEEGNTITPIEALNLFRCMRLASRINDLRRDGHIIATDIIQSDNNKRWARYRILKQIK